MRVPGERRWLVHLAIPVAIGGLVWLGDFATGRHLASGFEAFALKLAIWYEDRRIPTVLCSPRKPVPYTSLAGIAFEVPECWHSESTALLDHDVHRFFDPDARAGTVSVSVERIETDEDREALRTEFATLASRPTARVEDDEGQAVSNVKVDHEAPRSETGVRVHSAADSLAERFGDQRDAPAGAAGASSPFRRVETVGILGPAEETTSERSDQRFAARPSEGEGPRRAWNWLLLSDRLAVRIVYTVREDWVGETAVTGELKRVRALADSVKPAP